VTVSAPLTELSPDTTYYFRIVAANAGGTSFGALETATTPPTPPGETTSTPPGETTSQPPLLTPPSGPALTGIAKQGVLGSLEEKTVANAQPRLMGVSLAGHPAGILSLKLSCPAATHCSGTVTLRSLPAGSPAHRGGTKAVTFATATFTLRGGAHATLKLRLTAAARKLIARHRVLRAWAIIALHGPAGGGSPTETPVTLRRP